MLYHISKLHSDEQELIKKAPLLVTILVAGADGSVHNNELDKSIELIHIKSFSESSDIRLLYKEIDHDVKLSLIAILKELPTDGVEREKRIIDQLAELNPILAKMEPHISREFYLSLKDFAFRVAQTSGGLFGFNTINYHEKEAIKLSMINEPIG